MALLKGQRSAGTILINDPVRFLKPVDFASQWGDTFYIDNTDGSDSNDGKSTSTPFKTLRYALTAAGPMDTIYIRPKAPDTAGGDPTSITPDTAVNWTVPYTAHGLSIIGCGPGGHGKSANYMTGLSGYSAITTPVLYVKAPYVNLENLCFRRGSSTDSALKFSFSNAGPDWSFGNTVYNCTFWQVGSTATAGALNMDSAWHSSVVKCSFQKCYVGIYIGASNSVPVGILIDECDFQGLTTDISCNILSSGAVTNILMKRLYMNHVLPSAGGSNKFIVFTAASTGQFMDSYIGATATTVATNTTLNGVGYTNIMCGSNIGLMTTA